MLLVREGTARCSHLLIGLGRGHHCSTKNHDSDSDVRKALEATEGVFTGFWALTIDVGKLTVDRELYIEAMLERIPKGQCTPLRNPANLDLKPEAAQIGDVEVDQKICRSLVGSDSYLVEHTRPDVMFTLNLHIADSKLHLPIRTGYAENGSYVIFKVQMCGTHLHKKG